VAALLEGIGSGAVSNPVRDVLQAEVVLVIGANPTCQPPGGRHLDQERVRRGTKLIVMDPRRTELARHAARAAVPPDTDVALLNAMMHVIVDRGPGRPRFIAARTERLRGAGRERARLQRPRRWRRLRHPAETMREVARLYASSRASMILWGMGISQHVHGTDNARCLIALALMTGQIGRPGTGLHPLRGQNNVQGASDAGLIPMMYPDYQRVDDAAGARALRARLGRAARQRSTPQPGLTVVEIMHAPRAGAEVRRACT
jgi:formate dehydrogenase major subunit